MAVVKNPLLSAQREKAGSETAADYAYQYHWALYRAIQEQSLQNEYAVFVELHEDVVVCNSLDNTKAKFQFSQVKTTKAKFSETALLKLKNGKSVVGKLISSGVGKPFFADITDLSLVAVSGFGIKLKKHGLNLTKITLQDIDDGQLKKIADAIKKELGVDPLPTNLQFIIPDLPDKDFQNYIIAEISKLITTLHPGAHYNSVDIYRILIDELNRKGQVVTDFSDWNDLLKNKALTSITVTKVINQFTNIKDEAKVEAEFAAIVSELKLKVISAKTLRQSFTRYRQTRIGNRSVAQLDITAKIKSAISQHLSAAGTDISVLIDLVLKEIADTVKKELTSDNDIKAAIICEYIMED